MLERTSAWLYTEPLWLLYAATTALLLLTSEIGYRAGRFQNRNVSAYEQKSTATGIAAAVLGLLAFMLAFTFSNAGSRFAERKQLVVDEANAIGTAYLRTQLIPDPQGATTRALLRDYVDARLEIVSSKDWADLERGLAGVDEAHARMWSQAVELARAHPDSVAVGLFASALNDVIDLHAKRLAVGIRNRIPTSIWAAIYFLALIATAIMGYDAGLGRARNTPAMLALCMAFSAVVLLVVDLDRPHQVMFSVSQQALTDLQAGFKRPAP